MKIGDVLKKQRHLQGLSLQDLSRSSGVVRSTISMIETNKTTLPNFITAIKICRALDLDINDVYRRVENEEEKIHMQFDKYRERQSFRLHD